MAEYERERTADLGTAVSEASGDALRRIVSARA
jgi:hypothetical protein